MAKKKKYNISKYLKDDNSASPSSSSYVGNQVGNLKEQLTLNDQDPSKALDNRNVLEKTLNLSSDTGTLVDPLLNFFELLGRPQQSIFGGINAALEGKDFLEGASKGLSGEQVTYGGDILRNLGVKDSGDAIGLDDILGFGLDIFADPMDLIGVGLVGDASKAVGAIGDASKAVGAVGDTTKLASKADDVIKVGVKLPFTKIGQDLITPNDAIFDAIGKGVGKGAKAVDTSLVNKSPLYRDIKNEIIDVFNTNARLDRNATRVMANEVAGKSVVGADIAKRSADNMARTLQQDILNNTKLVDELGKVGIDMVNDPQAFNKLLNIAAESGEVDSLLTRGATKGFTLREIADVNKQTSLNSKLVQQGGKTTRIANTVYLPNSNEMKEYMGTINDYIAKNLGSNATKASKKIFKDNYPNIAEALKDVKTKGGKFNIGNKLWGEASDNLLKVTSPDIAEELIRLSENSEDLVDALPKLREGWSSNYSTDISLLFNKNGGKDIFDKLKTFTRDVYKTFDKELAGNNAGLMGKWQENLYYAPNRVNENVLSSLKKVSSDYDNFKSPRNLTKNISSGEYNKFIKEVFDLDDASFMPSLQGAAREDFKRIINEEGFFLDSESFIQDLKNTLDAGKSYSYAGRVSDTYKFNNYILNGAGENIINDFNFVNSTKDELGNYNWSAILENLKTSDSSIHYVPNTADAPSEIGKAVRTQLNSKYQSFSPSKFKGMLDEITKEINRGFDLSKEGSKVSDVINEVTLPQHLQQLFNDIASQGELKGNIYVDKQVAHYLNLLRDTNSTLLPNMVDMINKINTIFKQGKLLSPGFNIRNVIGNGFNMIMAGVPVTDTVYLLKKGLDYSQYADEGIKALRAGAELSSVQKKALSKVNELRNLGYSDAGTLVQGLEDVTKNLTGNNPITKAVGAINKANVTINNTVDLGYRLAMMDYAKANQGWMKKMGFANPGEAVAFALFDPGDLSLVEQNTLRKVIPFYTFTKKNLAYQIQNLPKNGSLYYNLHKGLNSLWNATGLEDDEINDYRKTGLEIPLAKTKDGKVMTLAANLPYSDLLEFIENPARRLASSTSPLIRAPFEAALNINTFSGMPISNFKGEKGDILSRTPIADTPLNTANMEWLLGNLGLDTPIKTTANVWDLLTNTGPDKNNLMSNLANLSGVIKYNDPAKAKLANEYEQLQKLKDYISLLEQGGTEILTKTQISESQKDNPYAQYSRAIDDLMNPSRSSNPYSSSTFDNLFK